MTDTSHSTAGFYLCGAGILFSTFQHTIVCVVIAPRLYARPDLKNCLMEPQDKLDLDGLSFYHLLNCTNGEKSWRQNNGETIYTIEQDGKSPACIKKFNSSGQCW